MPNNRELIIKKVTASGENWYFTEIIIGQWFKFGHTHFLLESLKAINSSVRPSLSPPTWISSIPQYPPGSLISTHALSTDWTSVPLHYLPLDHRLLGDTAIISLVLGMYLLVYKYEINK